MTGQYSGKLQTSAGRGPFNFKGFFVIDFNTLEVTSAHYGKADFHHWLGSLRIDDCS